MERLHLSGKEFKWICITILFVHFIFAVSAQPVLSFTPIPTSGLIAPLYITNAGDSSNRLFIVERGGAVKIYDGNTVLPTPFLDISKIIVSGGERGLLSIAFHPDYKTNRYFFVYYNNLGGQVTIARYQTQADNPNVADSLSGVVLLNIPKPFNNHNGGTLAFGKDGYLYFATGDGGGAGDPNNNAQNGNSLLGKMIRLNVTTSASPPYYTIPPDNPFINDAAVRDEIWALGLRNPFRWSFDRLTGDIWIGDVGQSAREEIDFEPVGSTGGNNYGWRCYEGDLPYNTTGCLPQNNYTSPIFDYDRSSTNGGSTVIGGRVYRGSNFPLLYGYYVCVDYLSTNGWLIVSNGSNDWIVTKQSGLPTSIAAFGEDENGELYAVSLAGTLYQVKAETVLPLRLTEWYAQVKNNNVTLSWKTAFEQNLRQFDIEYSTNSLNFTKLFTIAASNTPSGNSYNYGYRGRTVGKFFYRLKITDKDDGTQYSKIISINAGTENLIYSTVIDNGLLNIQINTPFNYLTLYSTDGKKILKQSLTGETGRISIPLPDVPSGVYLVQFYGNTNTIVQKIIIR